MSAIHLNKENFEIQAGTEGVTALVDFWADWCGPCKMMGPVVDALSEELEGKIKVCKVNVDEEPELASKYNIMSIPTVILLKDGEEKRRLVGAMPKEELIKILD